MANQFYPPSLSGYGRSIGMWRKVILFVFALCGLTFAAQAQGIKVSGNVKDSNGEELPGVTVQVKGTTNGVSTDFEGNYVLNNVPSDGTIVFSFVGMQTKEEVVGNRSVIDVTLDSDDQTLEEVVVVGYGTQKRKSISGTVSTVDSKDFNPGVVTNPLAAAQGKVAGLVITQSSGDPNSSPTVRLRGTGSLSAGSGPLYVIDGVIGAPIENVNPNDIATIDVLRDASSAAIYGSRGANGVIIITTKRGKSGKTSVDFNTYYGFETIAQKPDLMNGSEFRQAAQKFGVDFDDNGANTDWLDVITRTANTQNYNLSVSGGSQNSSYRASVGYLDQVGTMIGSDKSRWNARLNLDSKALNDKLNLKFNFSAINSTSGIAQNIALGLAQNMRPTDPVYNSDGTYFQLPGTFSNFNPLAVAENRRQDENLINLLSNVQANYTILPGLVFHLGGTLRTETKNTNAFQNSNAGVPVRSFLGNSAFRGLDAVNDKQFESTLNYVKDLGSSNFNVLVGYTYQDVEKNGFGVSNNNFLTDLLHADNIGLGLGIRSHPDFIGSYKNEYKLVSFLGRVQYSLKDKYFATANFRRDGSTKFGDNNKWGFFPSLSVGWAISEEPFMQSLAWLDNMKIRASWGRTGNSEGIDPLQSRSFYGQNGTYYDGETGTFLPAYQITSNPNPDLKWEVNENYGIGVDFSIMKGKLSGSLDYYTRQTKDLLYTVNAPQEAGYVYPTILANVGSMQNEGFESTLTYQWVDKTDFSFSSTLAASINHNEVIGLSSNKFAAPDRIFLTTSLGNYIRGTSAVNFSVLTKGHPVGAFYGAIVDHIDDQGKYVFKDLNGDGVVDPNSDDRTYIGNPNPVFVGSLTNNFRYKNFDLMFMLTSNLGNDIMNTNRLLIGRQDGRIAESNALKSALTSPINDNTTIPMDYYVEKGNFLRVNNASLGYNLPVKGDFINRVRFYIAGNNLLLFTKYTGVDPEVSQELKVDGDNRRAPGIDVRETYYKTRAFTIGANLSF
ncbi:TonB-dependent receptor [Marinilongibacter aquaticus]|uniref:SusC/RagA family TonB-linked outer membrane protein n=1 Tax=Marinilongibacter aquaticus TaxID=2975157 RepID=UPI0021BD50B3|nr:TonB-dependent receptor [Marinilongibacter aquaticus]UBM57752.1 TonB-dependent receptor [Marinilongibacter aquaticus]